MVTGNITQTANGSIRLGRGLGAWGANASITLIVVNSVSKFRRLLDKYRRTPWNTGNRTSAWLAFGSSYGATISGTSSLNSNGGSVT